MHFNFIHGSDFHLGYFQYNLHERFLDFARTFKAFINYGLEHDVEFILIAGDLFEKRNINAPTYLQAYNVLSWLQSECETRGRDPIKVIAIEGNHDLAYQRDRNSWLQILDSQGLLTLLKPPASEGITPAYVDVNNCRIFGVEYLGASTLPALPQIASKIREINQGVDKFTVLMMHFGMEGQARGEVAGEIPYNALLPLRECVDYLALGHYHSQYEYDNWVYNGGSLEMTSLGEYGLKKGFYHVTGESGAKLIHIPTRGFKRLSGDISSVNTPGELFLLVQSIVDNCDIPGSRLSPIVELTLWGNLNFPKKEISLPALKEIIFKKFNCLHAEIHIRQTNDRYTVHGSDLHGASREQIETKILTEQVLLDTRYKTKVKTVVSDIIDIKKLALSKASEDEIIQRLKHSLKQIRPTKNTTKQSEELPFIKGNAR